MDRKGSSDDGELARRWRELAARAGIGAGERLVLGLSGGADSVALALLAAHGTPAGDRLTLVHVDHGWRDGRREEEFCRALAEELDRPLAIERVALDPGGPDAERVARDARYRALAERARRAGASVVLTAHHREDRFETALLTWRRRGALGGHLAIDRTRELTPGVRVVRPLLETSTDALRRWLTERGRTWCEDPSNADRGRARNAVRHDLVPLLRRVAAARGVDAHDLEEALAELGAARARIDDALDTCVPTLAPSPWVRWSRAPRDRALGGSCATRGLLHLATGVRAQVLGRLTRRASGTTTRGAVLDALAASVARADRVPRRTALGGGWIAQVVGERLDLLPPRAALAPAPRPRAIEVADGRSIELDDGRSVRLTDPARGVVRPWRPGDRGATTGGHGSRAMARALAERGVPAQERARVLVLEPADDPHHVLGPLEAGDERMPSGDRIPSGDRDRTDR